MGTWIVIGIVVLIVLWLVLTYNGLITSAWSLCPAATGTIAS